jgi:hypothetical protein
MREMAEVARVLEVVTDEVGTLLNADSLRESP